MNMTVGPLPPAVYWRRRAIVAAPILVLLFTLSMCVVSASGSAGSAGPKENLKTIAKATPTRTASPSPSMSGDMGSRANPYLPGVGVTTSPIPPQPSTIAPAPPPPTTVPPIACADADLSVTTTLEHQSYPVGSRLKIKIVIANKSNKPCFRDLGAGQQEVFVKNGDQRIWSSDDCSNNRAQDVRTLAAGDSRTYWVAWTGYTSAPQCPSGQSRAQAAKYQVYGRLGGLHSAPFQLALK